MGSRRYTRIDNAVFLWLSELGHKAGIVYVYVCYRSNPNTGTWCSESLDNMAKALKMDRHTLQANLKKLTNNGLIRVRRQKHAASLYQPIDPVPVFSIGEKPPTSIGVKPPIEDSSTGVKPHIEVGGKPPTNKGTDKQGNSGSATAPVHRLMETWKGNWEGVWFPGEHYSLDYGKDGRLFKTALKRGVPEHEIVAKMEGFPVWWSGNWRSRDGQRPTLGQFVSCLSEIPLPQTEREPRHTSTL